jgi:putative phosphoribosyl transferase
MPFHDREEAGRRLADRLAELELHRPVVLALPRGGVPVAAPVAAALGAPLDVLVARKVGAPGHTEFGIGAIAEGSDEVVISDAAARVGVSPEQMDALAAAEREELERRVRRYRGDAELPELKDRDVLLVDDGLATGVTAEAALRSLRRTEPRRLILAAPVSAPDTAERLTALADEVVCLECPPDFGAVGYWYAVFDQTTDDEVIALLEDAKRDGHE